MTGDADSPGPRSGRRSTARSAPDRSSFAVVIATGERAELLPEALDSVLAQTRPPDEILVVDDGSSDASAAVLAGYGDRLTVIRSDGGGLGHARNLAARRARADYLVLLDADDRLLPWALETWAQVAGALGAPALLMNRWHGFRDETEVARVERTSVVAQRWPDLLAAAESEPPLTTATAIRRETLLELGGFVEHGVGSEDIDLWLRFGEQPGFVFVESPVLYAFRLAPGATRHDPARLHGGVRFLLAEERRGRYGGGPRRHERASLLARNVCFAASRLAALGRPGLATDLLLRGAPLLFAGGQLQLGYRVARRVVQARRVAGRSGTPA